MPAPLAPTGPLVHPHQIEVQDFAWYALVIDARSARAYREDHIPGAVNIPAQTRTRNPVGNASTPAIDGAKASAERSLPRALETRIAALPRGGPVLVYCDRGGLDSLVWAEPLRARGWLVDVLAGGWGNYRRWVDAGLELLPRVLMFRQLVAPPVGGLCRILLALANDGEQVLDLAELAGQRLVPGLTLKGDDPPSQSAFETRLLDSLRNFDPKRPVWVRACPAPLRDLDLPPALRDALARADEIRFDVPLPERARAWLDRLQSMGTPITSVIDALCASPVPPSSTLVAQWTSMLKAGRTADALASIIATYIDPHSGVDASAVRALVLGATSLEPDAVVTAIAQLRCLEPLTPAANT
jgi:tRNA 2-selenouridine synthase